MAEAVPQSGGAKWEDSNGQFTAPSPTYEEAMSHMGGTVADVSTSRLWRSCRHIHLHLLIGN